MPTATLYSNEGKKIGEVELNEEIFAIEPNEHAVHMVVKAHLANRRQGTQSALTRAEVRGGGIKPWKQKGTGRARQGSTRSPQWRHGGIVFAPKPRDYHIAINKKVRRLALKSALSSMAADGAIAVFESIDLVAPKTREMAKILNAAEISNALIVMPGREDTVERAARNIHGIEVTMATTLSTYDILKHKRLILTKESLAKVEEVYI